MLPVGPVKPKPCPETTYKCGNKFPPSRVATKLTVTPGMLPVTLDMQSELSHLLGSYSTLYTPKTLCTSFTIRGFSSMAVHR
ncbi:hypothetical protein E2C01_011385 [Portunus trituberculatus]|uniref:Uncharacterized protein n=1 Tax=Portunus trituberculatus TaxID=210409 RepID=A0A5B7DB28_PORTR|nr:hypothetical protein [Portunus trituberculatus]